MVQTCPHGSSKTYCGSTWPCVMAIDVEYQSPDHAGTRGGATAHACPTQMACSTAHAAQDSYSAWVLRSSFHQPGAPGAACPGLSSHGWLPYSSLSTAAAIYLLLACWDCRGWCISGGSGQLRLACAQHRGRVLQHVARSFGPLSQPVLS